MLQLNYMEGGSALVDAIMCPPQPTGHRDYFAKGVQAVMDSANNFSERFKNTVQQTYDEYWDPGFTRQVETATRMISNVSNPDYAYPIHDPTQLADPSQYMKRWIMAEPELRTLHTQHSCQAYEGSYVDMYPQVTGMDHYDYRRVMSGVAHTDPDGTWKVCTIKEHLVENDRELLNWEKINILDTWNTIRDAITQGYDPTDPEFGDL